MLAARDPANVTATMTRSQRGGKVFVDWSQNDRHKTTVCAYSLRATSPSPGVSTPVTWDELSAAASARSRRGRPAPLSFTPDAVLARVQSQGDLLAPLLSTRQTLPQA